MSIKGFLISLIVFQYFHLIISENTKRFSAEKCRKPVLLLLKPLNFTPLKTNLFLYAFLSSGLSLSRLLRFYIFSLVPTKKPLTFVSYFRSILMSLSASNHQLPELSLFVVPALGVIHLWRPKKWPILWPIPPPASRLPLLLPPLTPMLKIKQ